MLTAHEGHLEKALVFLPPSLRGWDELNQNACLLVASSKQSIKDPSASQQLPLSVKQKVDCVSSVSRTPSAGIQREAGSLVSPGLLVAALRA